MAIVTLAKKGGELWPASASNDIRYHFVFTHKPIGAGGRPRLLFVTGTTAALGLPEANAILGSEGRSRTAKSQTATDLFHGSHPIRIKRESKTHP